MGGMPKWGAVDLGYRFTRMPPEYVFRRWGRSITQNLCEAREVFFVLATSHVMQLPSLCDPYNRNIYAGNPALLSQHSRKVLNETIQDEPMQIFCPRSLCKGRKLPFLS